MKKGQQKKAHSMYRLLLKRGVKVNVTSHARFKQDFEFEDTLESYAHKPKGRQKAEPVIYSLPGSNRQEKIKALQGLEGYTFISIRQFFKGLTSIEQPGEDKIVIGYPVTTLRGTFQGHHVYTVKDKRESLSFMSHEEIDQLIRTSPKEQVFAFILKCPA